MAEIYKMIKGIDPRSWELFKGFASAHGLRMGQAFNILVRTYTTDHSLTDPVRADLTCMHAVEKEVENSSDHWLELMNFLNMHPENAEIPKKSMIKVLLVHVGKYAANESIERAVAKGYLTEGYKDKDIFIRTGKIIESKVIA